MAKKSFEIFYDTRLKHKFKNDSNEGYAIVEFNGIFQVHLVDATRYVVVISILFYLT